MTSSIEERGYEEIPLGDIDDTRLGALCRAMGRLTDAEEADWRANNPDFDGLGDEADWVHKLESVQSTHQKLSSEVISLANGRSPGMYSGAIAVFKAESPKLFVWYFGHNDDPASDHRSINRLYAFDGFADNEEGLEIAHIAVGEALKNTPTTHAPSASLGIPEDFFIPHLRQSAAV